VYSDTPSPRTLNVTPVDWVPTSASSPATAVKRLHAPASGTVTSLSACAPTPLG
jgi:hypothetical protein